MWFFLGDSDVGENRAGLLEDGHHSFEGAVRWLERVGSIAFALPDFVSQNVGDVVGDKIDA